MNAVAPTPGIRFGIRWAWDGLKGHLPLPWEPSRAAGESLGRCWGRPISHWPFGAMKGAPVAAS